MSATNCALKRDGFMIQAQNMRDKLWSTDRDLQGYYAEIKELRAQIAEHEHHRHTHAAPTPRFHPVKVGEWVERTDKPFEGSPIGRKAKVLSISTAGYLFADGDENEYWRFENCIPCDPPEATHDTPAGKQTAQAAVTPQPGYVVRLVREPTHTDIPAMLPWSNAFGMPGDTATVVPMAAPEKQPSGTISVRTAMGRILFWPLSCVEVVDAK